MRLVFDPQSTDSAEAKRNGQRIGACERTDHKPSAIDSSNTRVYLDHEIAAVTFGHAERRCEGVPCKERLKREERISVTRNWLHRFVVLHDLQRVIRVCCG